MRVLPLATLVASLAAFSVAHDARAQVSDPIQYMLRTGSRLEYGCMGPCDCPIVFSNPLKGDFTFYRTGVDPLFTHYALTNINWEYTVGDTGTAKTHHVRGQGTYDVGGEIATEQRMILDLITDDTLVQHFDSGFVPVHATFPVIDIDVHTNPSVCFDTLIHVVATPQGFVGATEPTAARMLGNAVPNPSSSVVDLMFAPRSAGHATVDVIDVGGRVVAMLVDGPVTAGVHQLRWDGRRAGGAEAGPGIYWVRARLEGHEEWRRIARIR